MVCPIQKSKAQTLTLPKKKLNHNLTPLRAFLLHSYRRSPSRTTQPRTVEGGLRPHPFKTGLRPEPGAEQLDCADQLDSEVKKILRLKILSLDFRFCFLS
jgi:hypothetical protein